MPGAPLLRRTATHARHKTSLRKTLSRSAWNRRPGSALAARYSACWKARTGSRNDPEAAELAITALTGPLLHTTRVDEVAALPITGGSVVRSAQPVLRPPPTPSRPAIHFPRSSVIGRHAPATPSAGHRAGEGLPSSRRHYLNVPRPYAGEFLAAAIQELHRFRGLHPDSEGLGSPLCHQRWLSNDAAGFASRYGPLSRSPSKGLRHWASTPRVSRQSRQSATGPPGS